MEEFVERKILIEQLLSFCTQPRYVDIVCRYYGIGRPTRQTLREIADDYGLTHERIRQIKTKAERQMKAGAAKEAKYEARLERVGL